MCYVYNRQHNYSSIADQNPYFFATRFNPGLDHKCFFFILLYAVFVLYEEWAVIYNIIRLNGCWAVRETENGERHSFHSRTRTHFYIIYICIHNNIILMYYYVEKVT